MVQLFYLCSAKCERSDDDVSVITTLEQPTTSISLGNDNHTDNNLPEKSEPEIYKKSTNGVHTNSGACDSEEDGLFAFGMHSDGKGHRFFRRPSHSAFSTGGLIIDDFRASLTPQNAEALICTQD
ncbi:hypothetical protein OROMI_012488 [Orobanche minor]